MPADKVSIRVQGIQAAVEAMRGLSAKLRRQVLGKAVKAAAAVYKKRAQEAVPVLASPTPYRKPGTLKRAIKVRLSKVEKRKGNVGAFVNVKLLPGNKYRVSTRKVLGVKVKQRQLVKATKRSAKNPNDPFYWRFVEFGTAKMPAKSFLRQAAVGSEAEAVREFERVFVPAVAAINQGRQP